MSMDLSLSLLLIRFVVGLLLVGHGAQKVLGVSGGPGLRRWIGAVGAMGFRPAPVWAALAASAELLGGLGLALGFLTPVAAAFLVGSLFVAIAKAHWAKGLWVQGGGYEYPLVLLLVSVAVGLGGPGLYSIDAALGWHRLSGVVFVPLAALAVIADAVMLWAAARTAQPAAPRRAATETPRDARRDAA